MVYGSVIRKKMHLFSTSDSLVDKVIHFTVWLIREATCKASTHRKFFFCSDAYFS